jgi:NADH:ubiquinone oxidoreductase subunit 5 (subunit L)/multisubunit Na+/H+ antiporter MnhA subunit
VTAASGAASGARPGLFDPFSTLAWAVPILVIAPLAAFVIAITGVRTRRSASNTALFGAVVSLLATLLVGWGLAKKSVPFVTDYQYFNLSVAFNGPTAFQSFGIDIVLRVDHLTVVALLVVELCVLGTLGWHRVMGRSEAGGARFHAIASLFLFGSAGTLVSNDLAELVTFWGLTGAATYLLLAHRWGLEAPARATRIALALPFLTDLFLLCGIAVLYSRYGVQTHPSLGRSFLDLTTLVPILHTASGWTVKALVVASVLVFVGIAGRLALWPLSSWFTRTTVDSPAAASAMTQAVWSVLAVVVLYRFMPIFAASNLQTLHALLYGCGAAAIIAPLIGLVTNEPRRAIALIGSGVAAVGAAVVIDGYQNAGFTFAVAGVACVLAAALARVAASLTASVVSIAMRTDDLTEMGDAWRRTRASAVALLVAGIVLGLSAAGALGFSVSSSSRLGLALGEAVLLVSIASMRIFLAIAIGPLRRRRAFEPDRVRDAPSSSLTWAFVLAAAGVALVAASFAHNWLEFLDGRKHPVSSTTTYLLWIAVAVIGFAAASIAYSTNKYGAARASSALGGWANRGAGIAARAVSRFVVGPAVGIAGGTGDWILRRDDAVADSVLATGRLVALASRFPVVPVVILLGVVLAVGLALLSPGVFR